jgi:hypothetical protein
MVSPHLRDTNTAVNPASSMRINDVLAPRVCCSRERANAFDQALHHEGTQAKKCRCWLCQQATLKCWVR